MSNRKLSEDTKVYNLFQKYRKYKGLIASDRVNKYIIFDYPEYIDVEGTENTISYIIKKEKKSKKKNKEDDVFIIKEAKRIQKTKDLYGKYYTPDKVNHGSMSKDVFSNIINYGDDAVSKFSIDYDFTKHIFKLTSNPIIFDIQDDMFDFLSSDNNIEKLYELEDEIKLYNEARKYILTNTSSSYNKLQKIDKLSSIKSEFLLKNKVVLHDKELKLINKCIDIIKVENYNSPELYKASLLLKKNIINIDTIDIAKAVIKYSKLK